MYKKILILGANGLIGNNILRYLVTKRLHIFPCVRNPKKKIGDGKNYYYGNLIKNDKINFKKIDRIISDLKPDMIINCIGTTKHKKVKQNHFDILNFKLIELLLKFKVKIINFSTDCIFAGNNGNYKETSVELDKSLYAKSKIKVENIRSNFLINLRTSAFGKERLTKNGLFEWFICKKKVFGYKFAYFSGPTCHEIAQIIYNYIILRKKISFGTFNIGGRSINKYDLLTLTNDIYKKNKIILENKKIKINRTLNIQKFIKKTSYKIKSWKTMLTEMKKFDEKSF